MLAKGPLCAVLLFTLLFAACARAEPGTTTRYQPAKVEKMDGDASPRLVLTRDASERIDLQTVLVREESVESAGGTFLRKVIPYSALIYDAKGNTLSYTSPEPLTFVRWPVVVEYISDDVVVLTEGPPLGTSVVVVGGAELLGVEFGIGK